MTALQVARQRPRRRGVTFTAPPVPSHPARLDVERVPSCARRAHRFPGDFMLISMASVFAVATLVATALLFLFVMFADFQRP
jgi:hypothetical protein